MGSLGRFFVIFAFLILGAAAGLLVAPGFVDWNRYHDQIESAASQALGRQVSIGGNIAFTMLPRPALTLEQIRVANREGGIAEDLVTLDRLDSQLQLAPLLRGQIRVTSFHLIGADLSLERDEDGQANWDLLAQTDTVPESTTARAGDWVGQLLIGAIQDVRVDSLSVEDLSVSFDDQVEKLSLRTGLETGELSMDSLRGPFRGSGRAIVLGRVFDLKAEFGRLGTPRPIPLTLSLSADGYGSDYGFNGFMIPDPDGRKVSGRVKFASERVDMLLKDFLSVTRAEVAPWLEAANVALPAVLEGGVIMTQADFSAINLDFSVGGSKGQVNTSFAFGDSLSGEISLAGNSLNADEIVEAFTTDASQVIDRNARLSTADRPYEIRVSLASDAIIYNGAMSRDVGADFTMRPGQTSIERLKAVLPGETQVSFDKAEEATDTSGHTNGKLSIQTSTSRPFFEWLGVDVKKVPMQKFRKLDVAADVRMTKKTVQIDHFKVALDKLKGEGALIAIRGERPSYGITLEMNAFNPSIYGIGTRPSELAKRFRTFDANVDVEIDQFWGFGLERSSVALKSSLMKGLLKLERLRFDGVDGQKIALSGELQANSANRFDGELVWSASGLMLCEQVFGPLSIAPECSKNVSHEAAGTARFDSGKLSVVAKGDIARLSFDGTLAGAETFWRKDSTASFEFTGRYEGGELYLKGDAQPVGEGAINIAAEVAVDALDAEAFLTSLNIPFSSPGNQLTALTATAHLESDASHLKVENFSALAGGQSLSGRFTFEDDGKAPKFNGVFKAEGVSFSSLVDENLWALGRNNRAWSTVRFKKGFVDGLTGTLSFDGTDLTADDVKIPAVSFVATIGDSKISADNLTATMWDGVWQGRGEYLSRRGARGFAVNVSSSGANVAQMLTPLFGSAPLQGTGQVSLNLSAQGHSPFGMVSTLSGSASVDMAQGRIVGFDLDAFSNAASAAKSEGAIETARSSSLGTGQTRFDRLTSQFTIANGSVKSVVFDGNLSGGNMTAGGQIDLGTRSITGEAMFGLSSDVTLPPIRVKLAGNMSKPATRWDLDALKREIGVRYPTSAPVPTEGAAPDNSDLQIQVRELLGMPLQAPSE